MELGAVHRGVQEVEREGAARVVGDVGGEGGRGGAAVVEVRGVRYAYGRTAALEDVGLEVRRGVTLGLIGPNGGGKTTLLRLMLGELTPAAGEVRVEGLSPREAVRRGNLVGYLPQHSHDLTRLPITVREAVRLGLSGKAGLLRPYAKEDVAFADAMVERVGLGEMRGAALRSLSGGQLQRVYIARALAPRPRLLLLDEPTTGIDRASQERLIDLIAELRAELGLTIVLVSHDLRAVTRVCDRIAVLDVTLHYHDVPTRFPETLAREKFCCDLEAMGLTGGGGTK